MDDCHNVHFNNYYSPPDNEIKARLLKIEHQLANMQKKIDSLTGKKPKLGEYDPRRVGGREGAFERIGDAR